MFVVDSSFHDHISNYFHRVCCEVIAQNYDVFGGFSTFHSILCERLESSPYRADGTRVRLELIVEYGLANKLIERLYHS